MNICSLVNLHSGVDLQRNRHSSDWHDYDRNVLQDCLDLGGVEEPDWLEQ